MKYKQITKHVSCVLMLTSLFLVGCKETPKPAEKAQTILTIKPAAQHNILHYESTLSPLETHTVFAPLSGKVRHLFVRYGDTVTQGDPLLSIDAAGISDDHNKIVSTYLEQKSTYTNTRDDYRGAQALYKAGVISKNEYSASRAQYRSALMNYYQAKTALESFFKKAKLDTHAIETLTTLDETKTKALFGAHFQDITVYAHQNGFILFPDEKNDKTETLSPGKAIKEGDGLMSIAAMSGFALNIQVDETNINAIKKGMSATIIPTQHPNLMMPGIVTFVAQQSQPSENKTQATFPVSLAVHSISKAAKEQLRFGMTARIALSIEHPQVIQVPIQAVHMHNKHASLLKRSKKDGDFEETAVITGTSGAQTIEIRQGLTAGDQILVPNLSPEGQHGTD
jgi:multidrug efflux pump subunit AcrA (membrane-fusion protein)